MAEADPKRHAFIGARVWSLAGAAPPAPLEGGAVLVEGGRVQAVVRADEVPAGTPRTDLGAVELAPGFVDLQVNGGGGVLLNDAPEPGTVERIAAAHRAFGTTSLLPTLITDTTETIAAARRAVNDCVGRVPGVIGVHFEGPFLDGRRAGAHDPSLVRDPLPAADGAPGDLEAMFDDARGVTLVTAAAVRLAGGLLEELLGRGALVSLGHCAAEAAEAHALFERGVTGVTHLFNAMSPLLHRAPGVVGAALAHDRVTCGLIVDGHHVDPLAARAAWKALGTDRLALVTDAVQPVGTGLTEFSLGGQRVRLEDGRCVNEDGNLAGSALDMASAVRGAVRAMGVPLGDALAMASRTPARLLGLDAELGRLVPGARADLVALDEGLRAVGVVQGGVLVEGA